MSQTYDLVVLGAGSGGIRAARTAAGLGARVAVVDHAALGGTCVNVGCIPKKLLSYASHLAHAFADARGYGWASELPAFDWAALVRNKDRELSRLHGIYARLLASSGVELVVGRGIVTGPTSVQVGDRELHGRHLLIATGAKPRLPDIPGISLAHSSNDMFSLPSLPRQWVILGGGFIGLEFAGILAGLGCDVELVHTGALPLRGFDDDVRRFLCDELAHHGIRLHLGTSAQQISRREDGQEGLVCTLASGVELECHAVLAATGREPNTRGIGLEAVGVKLGPRGEVVVDAELRSSVSTIFAVGDAIDRMALTPVALAEGMSVARGLFGPGFSAVDYDLVPTAVFSDPPVAAVGLSEALARERGHKLRVFRSAFTPLFHQLSGRKQRTMVKLVVDAQTDKVLGVHMVGSDAPEILQGFATALVAGATKAQFDATIGIHPTAAEELVTLRTPVSEDP
jgi:glutathione reductase (NADPH)